VPAPPEELRSLIEETFGPGIAFEEAMPECIVQLDEFEGEQRNSDLVILCGSKSERIVISIEAKADEPFGDTAVGDYYDRKLNTKSNIPNRIKKLSTGLFGTEPDGTVVRTLRYQLVHSAGAALIAAKAQEGDCAVFSSMSFMAPVSIQKTLNET
jgi:hypothetical protein